MDQASHNCPWCSASIPAGAANCPSCGATVEGENAPDVPGLTVVDPHATLGEGEGLVPDIVDPVAWLTAGHDDRVTDEEAVHPPSAAVEREIERMKLEAEIENAGRSVMNPMGDEAINVGAPSAEAVAAFEAGLLGNSGPAEEAELDERAQGLETDKRT